MFGLIGLSSYLVHGDLWQFVLGLSTSVCITLSFPSVGRENLYNAMSGSSLTPTSQQDIHSPTIAPTRVLNNNKSGGTAAAGGSPIDGSGPESNTLRRVWLTGQPGGLLQPGAWP